MRKYVFTGGPCSGKSTILELLDKKGYDTIGECAREIVEERKDNPLTDEENTIRQNLIYDVQLSNELDWQNKSSEGDILFLDRALPDLLGYTRYLLSKDWDHGVPKELKKYSKVMIFEIRKY